MSFKNELSGKKITIIGSGISGRAAAKFASSAGAKVFVSEIKQNISEETSSALKDMEIPFEFGGHSERTWKTDLIVLSSSVSPSSPAVKGAFERGIPVTSELDFVYPFIKDRIIGVTGSNGKTTTTSLIGHFLEACGYKTAVAGNIGNPASLYAGVNLDFLVLELSSFQLYWIKSLKVDLGIITNLAPDHIDWHGSFENYVKSKSKLIKSRKPGAPAIIQLREMKTLDAESCHDIVPLSWSGLGKDSQGILIKGEKIFLNYDGSSECLAEFKDIPLLGKHNVENVAMALAAIRLLKIPPLGPSELFKGYIAPKHRCQFVAKINGITFIDDSKGTNVAATSTALGSIKGEKIIILGGKGKGEDYTPLVKSIKENANKAIVLGEEKVKIIKALLEGGFSNVYEVKTMEEAVLLAYKIASPGETVLLSPACTSWDMYESYVKRGEHFISLVNKLGKAGRNVGIS